MMSRGLLRGLRPRGPQYSLDNYQVHIFIAIQIARVSSNMNESLDDNRSYCRMLGHYVPFRYCRTVNETLPCRKIKDCWFERMDIENFIGENYTDVEIERIFTVPSQKITTLVDLINKARNNS